MNPKDFKLSVNRWRHAMAATAVLALATACAYDGGVSPVGSASPGFKREFDLLANTGAAPLEVVGNPFGTDDAAFAVAVADALQGSYYGPETTFVPGGEPINGRRLVFWFDPAFDPSISTVCRNPAETGHADNGPAVSMLMALCIDDDPRIQFSGTLANAAGPEDPAFRAMVADAVRSLVATRDPMSDSRGCTGTEC